MPYPVHPLQSSARAASGDYSGPQIGFDVAPPAVEEALPAGSPADESAEERADRFAAQRSLLDRAFSRCGILLGHTLCCLRYRARHTTAFLLPTQAQVHAGGSVASAAPTPELSVRPQWHQRILPLSFQ